MLYVSASSKTNTGEVRTPSPVGPLTTAFHAVYGPTVAIRATVSGHCRGRQDIPHGGSGTEGLCGSPVKHFYLLNDRARTWLGSSQRCDDAIYAACMRAVSDYSRNHGYEFRGSHEVLIHPARLPELFVWPCFGRPTHETPSSFERWREHITLPEAYSDAVYRWTPENRFSLTSREAQRCELEASRRVKLLCASLQPLSGSGLFEMNSPDLTLGFCGRMVQLQEKLGERIPESCRVAPTSIEEVKALHKDRAAYIAQFQSFERINSAYHLYVDTFYEAAARQLFEKLCNAVYRRAAQV